MFGLKNQMSVLLPETRKARLGEGLPGGARGKEPTCKCKRCKRHRFGPWVGKSPWRGHGSPLQYSSLENPIPWTEEPGGLQFKGHRELDTTRATWHACRLGEGPVWAECFSMRGDGGGRDGSEYGDIMETSFWIY